MDRNEMLRLFEAHREAEATRDIGAILELCPYPFVETMPLGLRSEAGTPSGRPTSSSSSRRSRTRSGGRGIAFGDGVSLSRDPARNQSRGVARDPSRRGTFAVPFADAPFSQQRMAGDNIYFDPAALCEQARLPPGRVRATAAARRAAANKGG